MPGKFRLVIVLLAVSVVAAACSSDPPETGTSSAIPSDPSESPGSTPSQTPAAEPTLTEVWSGLDKPLFVSSPPDDARVFVVEQRGTLRVAADTNSPLAETAFLDISDDVTDRGEQGLLGLAFDPEFAQSGRVFVNFSDQDGNTNIDEITVDPDTGTEPATIRNRRTILEIDQPFANHNAGMLAFGPDGLLYVGTGDGGSANDPENNAQNADSQLGKMLRLDVADGGDAVPETYAIGLRNPYRYSFDRATSDLWIGDVGQNAFEEIDVIRHDTPPVVNLGWRIFEGRRRADSGEIDHHEPVAVYPLGGEECAVVGGYVYRGPGLEQFQGTYFFGDFCSGNIRTLDAEVPGEPALINDILDAPRLAISSFGEDAAGRLYVADHEGSVYRLDERRSGA